MPILTNGEILHAFIQPIKDRVEHYSDIVNVISSPFCVDDAEGFDAIKTKASELIQKGQSVITMTDPFTHKLFSFKFDVRGDIIEFIQCVADNTAATYAPVIDETIGKITKTVTDEIQIEGDFILKSADGLIDKSLDGMAGLSVDMLNVYNMMSCTVQNIITKGEVNVADLISTIKAKTSGVRGVAKTYFEDLTDAAQSNNITSIIEVIKKYMNNDFLSASADGSWEFSESVVTKDWNLGFVISGLANVVQTIGSIVTGLFAPVGLILSGVGAVANSVVSAISQKFNSDTIVKVEESEGRELAYHLIRGEVTNQRAAHSLIGEMINGKGPCHFEFLGLDGHIWSTNSEDPNVLVTGDPIRVEFFPSTKGYVDSSDLYDLVNDLIATTIDAHMSGQQWWDVKHTIKVSFSLKDLAEWYINHLIPVDWDNISDADADLAAGHCWETAMTMYALMGLAELPSGTDAGTYICNNSMGYNNLTGVIAARRASFVNYSLPGSSQVDFPKTQGYIHEGQLTWPWTTLSDISQHTAQAFDDYATAVALRRAENVWVTTQSVGDQDNFFTGPFQYIVTVRYPFHVLPPAYSRASLIAGIVLTTAIVVIAAAAAAVTFVKINQWRQKQQALTQAKTEQAWSDLTKNPTMENVTAYRKACLKQNTIGKVFGCSPISNKNYWGGGADEGSADASLQTVITLIRG